jgi:ribosomal protein S18 acetylase RimI-like enzyme
MKIIPYQPEFENAVIDLWRRCDLIRSWNNPKLDIERMLKVYPELFLVGILDNNVIATVMGGYDGHRGWIYYLGVDPAHKRKGLGRQIMEAVTEKLKEMGCPKINLMFRTDNLEAERFYEKIGYKRDEVVSMGKRLIPD